MDYFLMGVMYGLSAGLTPGALQTLVVSQTLKFGLREGEKVACAPLFTDIPIIALSIFLISKLADMDFPMACISFAGAGFLMRLAYGNFKITSLDLSLKTLDAGSLKKGVITNLLNPHPYLFWCVVGAPTIDQAYQEDLTTVGLFLFGMYLFLVGTLVFIAMIAQTSRDALKGRAYLYVIRGLGVVLFFFAIRFVWIGFEYLT